MPDIGCRKEYDAKMEGGKMFLLEDCPFCGSGREDNKILADTEHWEIFHNKYSYTGDERHLMAVPKKHKAIASELSPEELLDMEHVYHFMEEYFGEDHYFSFTRETMAGRSVEHYHIHFMPGTLKGSHIRYMLMLQGFPIEETLDPNSQR